MVTSAASKTQRQFGIALMVVKYLEIAVLTFYGIKIRKANELNVHEYTEKIKLSIKKDFSCLPLFPFTSLQEHFIMVDSCFARS